MGTHTFLGASWANLWCLLARLKVTRFIRSVGFLFERMQRNGKNENRVIRECWGEWMGLSRWSGNNFRRISQGRRGREIREIRVFPRKIKVSSWSSYIS